MTTKEKVMINGITASLANAARKIVEDSRAKAAEESAIKIAKLTEKAMKPAHSGTAPRNDQERKLAAMTPPKDKITHGDVLKGRGVTREEKVNEEEIGFKKLQSKIKKQGYSEKAASAIAAKVGREKLGQKEMTRRSVAARMKEEFDIFDISEAHQEEILDLIESPVDGVAPGSMEGDKHLCATKVFHKEWKEGKPLFSQHAEPDWNADGYISWYDVMFEHGIEKRVSTSDLKILTQESHMHSKKKKM